MRRRDPSRKGRIATTPSDAARKLLNDDCPPEVKAMVRLAVKGGRQRPQTCLACGIRRGDYVDVFIPHEAMRVGGDASAGLRVYWRCALCYVRGMTPELAAKLSQ
jgi:hypothetical protein